ncbi:hypothetical protein SmJEL517_g05318 [Synchytrium microbalum]|uniref:Acyl-CoA thioesterase II n=1 Tax=Synchytrium microbalum TaxID=1806994 RepID=A0A507BZS0_9FUNG|nr:uncharacterized protein SmJEL517_g05318 [Synchytrium microbalum]TPX31304.1 hypothetical protein SmJEL517_g05318 [Synchytrium microbalum]
MSDTTVLWIQLFKRDAENADESFAALHKLGLAAKVEVHVTVTNIDGLRKYLINHEDFKKSLDGIKAHQLYVYMDAECKSPLKPSTSITQIETSDDNPLRVVRPRQTGVAPGLQPSTLSQDSRFWTSLLDNLLQPVQLSSGDLPTHVIEQHLQSKLLAPLPLLVPITELLLPGDLIGLKNEFVQIPTNSSVALRDVAIIVMQVLRGQRVGLGQHSGISLWDSILCTPLQLFAQTVNISVEVSRNEEPLQSTDSFRPDSILYFDNLLMVFGQEKVDTNIGKAELNLNKMNEPLSAIFYGNVKTCFAYAADFRKLSINANGARSMLSPEFNLTTSTGRLNALFSVVNVFRLIRGLMLLNEADAFSPKWSLSREYERGMTTTLLFRNTFMIKTIRIPWENATIDDLRLAHSVDSPYLIKRIKEVVTYGSYSFHLAPIGTNIRNIREPHTGRKLCYCILKGLEALHSAGIVHRDIRLDNMIQVENRFILIDLEHCGKPGPLLPGFRSIFVPQINKKLGMQRCTPGGSSPGGSNNNNGDNGNGNNGGSNSNGNNENVAPVDNGRNRSFSFTQDEIAQLELEVEEALPDVFKSKRQWLPPYGRGIYGGQVLGQALASAMKTVGSQFRAHSMHSYFLLPADHTIPVWYHVERVRDGRNFITRNVAAKQRDRVIFEAMVSFKTPEASVVKYQLPMPIDGLPQPEDCERRDERVVAIVNHPMISRYFHPKSRQLMKIEETTPSFDIIDVSDHHFAFADGSMASKSGRLLFWLKTKERLSDDPMQHQSALMFISDRWLLGSGSVRHGTWYSDTNPQVTMMATLDHTVWMHADFRIDEYLLMIMENVWTGDGRSLAHGRFYSRDGRLVASCTQEGLIRTEYKDPKL